jgi:hypothetical protein
VVRIKYCGKLPFGCGRLMTQSTKLVSRNSLARVFDVCLPVVIDHAGLFWTVVCVSMIHDLVWLIMFGAAACTELI